MLCVEIQKGKLTASEIARNYREMSDQDHEMDVLVELVKVGRADEVADALSKLYDEENR